jgi:hypothetical protein
MWPIIRSNTIRFLSAAAGGCPRFFAGGCLIWHRSELEAREGTLISSCHRFVPPAAPTHSDPLLTARHRLGRRLPLWSKPQKLLSRVIPLPTEAAAAAFIHLAQVRIRSHLQVTQDVWLVLATPHGCGLIRRLACSSGDGFGLCMLDMSRLWDCVPIFYV